MRDPIKLDIMSDPICPWCYIGKAHLDKALAERPDHPFVIEWHPFQLNPDMPAGGMDRRAYLEGKFGGKEAAVRAYAPVVEHAEKAGLSINFEAMQTHAQHAQRPSADSLGRYRRAANRGGFGAVQSLFRGCTGHWRCRGSGRYCRQHRNGCGGGGQAASI